jgi:hypothetical protein
LAGVIAASVTLIITREYIYENETDEDYYFNEDVSCRKCFFFFFSFGILDDECDVSFASTPAAYLLLLKFGLFFSFLTASVPHFHHCGLTHNNTTTTTTTVTTHVNTGEPLRRLFGVGRFRDR